MSKYQYYEFQAIDRWLTKEEMAELHFRQSRSAGRREEETSEEERRTVGKLMAAAEKHAEKRRCKESSPS